MDWSGYSQEMRRVKKQDELVETERVVHNAMINLESHLNDGGFEEKVAVEESIKSTPRFWLYGDMLTFVCQRCDTTLFSSPEDADFADLEEAVQGHVCETGREGTA